MANRAALSSEFRKFYTRLSSGRTLSSLETWGPYPPQESILERANAFFRTEDYPDFESLVTTKALQIKRFDIAGMDRAVAICAAGRSGSVLLASYLDGHDDVILMPNLLSHKIYPFYERYQSLSLREKLIAFPFFQNGEADNFLDFFGGDFPVGAADYFAAVIALFETCRSWPNEVLESRRSFFRVLHVVYCVALGQRPVSACPIIVYAQHMLDAELARRFVEDFPRGRFIQTVRDPITSTGRLFEHSLQHRGFMGPWSVISYLTFAGLPHPGLESRTQVIRFEDLHLRLEETMRHLAAWLRLSYSTSLLNSTFHDRPYVWRSGANVWSGIRPKAAARDCRYTTYTDRWLLYSLLNEEFVAWNYSCPKFFRHAWARILCCALLVCIPTEMELTSMGALVKSWRSKGTRKAMSGAARILLCRVGIMSLVAVELYRRIVLGKKVLEKR